MQVHEIMAENNPYELPSRVLYDLRDSGYSEDLWPLGSPGNRKVLAVSSVGLHVFGAYGVNTFSWGTVLNLAVSSEALTFRGGGKDHYFALTAGEHAPQISATASRLGASIGSVDPGSQPRPSFADLRPAAPERPFASRTPAPAGSSHLFDLRGAGARSRRLLLNLFWGALGMQIVGGLILGLTWQRTEESLTNGELVETGSEGGMLIGYLVASVGVAMMLVVLIGWGVMLGVRAARSDD